MRIGGLIRKWAPFRIVTLIRMRLLKRTYYNGALIIRIGALIKMGLLSL